MKLGLANLVAASAATEEEVELDVVDFALCTREFDSAFDNMNAVVAELNELVEPLAELDNIVACMKETGIDDTLKRMVDADEMAVLAPSFAAGDTDAALAEIEVNTEGVGEAIKNTMKKLIAAMVAFFDKIAAMFGNLEKMLKVQDAALAKMKDAEWAEGAAEKETESFDANAIKQAISGADVVLKKLQAAKWDDDGIVDVIQTDTSALKPTKAKLNASGDAVKTARDLISKAQGVVKSVKELSKKSKELKKIEKSIDKMELGEGVKYKPQTALSAAQSIYGTSISTYRSVVGNAIMVSKLVKAKKAKKEEKPKED